mmetsp:Transcript_41612/g.96430  ORF Transcript_41612/g.96430 Transcript_41612/m.96430 type:complete len:93 (-) Transcript_41612:87-365(-)
MPPKMPLRSAGPPLAQRAAAASAVGQGCVPAEKEGLLLFPALASPVGCEESTGAALALPEVAWPEVVPRMYAGASVGMCPAKGVRGGGLSLM